MEHDNRDKLDNDTPVQKNEDKVENTETEVNETVDIQTKIASKIADLRDLHHELDPHKKFDLIEAWMGQIEEFSIYDNASQEQITEIIELMEGLQPFANEYATVLHTERGKIKHVSTYLK